MEDAKKFIQGPPMPADAELVWLKAAEYMEVCHQFEEMRWFISRVLKCGVEEITTTAMWAHLKPRAEAAPPPSLPGPPVNPYANPPLYPTPPNPPPSPAASTHENGAPAAPTAPSPKKDNQNGQ